MVREGVWGEDTSRWRLSPPWRLESCDSRTPQESKRLTMHAVNASDIDHARRWAPPRAQVILFLQHHLKKTDSPAPSVELFSHSALILTSPSLSRSRGRCSSLGCRAKNKGSLPGSWSWNFGKEWDLIHLPADLLLWCQMLCHLWCCRRWSGLNWNSLAGR